MTNQEQARLLDRVIAERVQGRGHQIAVYLDLCSAIQIVGALQLALRHPGCNGPIAETARSFVDGTIADLRLHGFEAHAELVELGNNPAHDEPAGDGVPR